MHVTFDDRQFRNAMGQFCTGVVIVTGLSEGRPVGFSAQSFVSVSLSPPLVSISPSRTSKTWPLLRDAKKFGINILGADQYGLCMAFAKSGGDKFAQFGWSTSPAGTPVLDDVLGFVECEFETEHDAGDHTVVLARVIDLDVFSPERSPLLFFRGRYGGFSEMPSV
ncbi:MAG: monooxygenase [Panacagrimonas sp.]|jgi:flavin reductase (DIM6/NTAB) family NADH-FMN oxidoreductase RutF|nr:flavin reductase family protein [Panacagrimonas sp.]MCC2657505.1 monooxygenase [Panacagrimonas sp.]